MRRDYFTLEVRGVDSSGLPTVAIDFNGPSDQLVGRLTDDAGEPLADEELDVTYRLRDDETGVASITNRVTGAYVLELNAEDEDVLEFIRAAREHGETDEGARYRVTVAIEGEQYLDLEKRTLLVYDADGELLRSESLIPSGVEL